MGAYVPQINRLLDATLTRGLSPYYVLFNLILSNAQFSETLLMAAYAWPAARRPVLKEIAKGRLEGWKAFGGLLGLVQMVVQWVCVVVLLLVFVKTRTQTGSGRICWVIMIVALLHIALVVLPAISYSLPEPRENHDMGMDIILAFIQMSNDVVAPSSLVLQFFAQVLEMRKENGDPGALSIPSLCLQMLAMSILAVRWWFRLGRLPWPFYWVDLRIWYGWGFTAVNYLMQAVVCGLLLVGYVCFYGVDRDISAAERVPLIAGV